MANGNLNDALARTLESPLFNTGIGLLAASGPSTVPVSLGQRLAQGLQFASRAQQQRLQNDLIRARLTENTRRQAALEKLRGVLPEQFGLLADIAPDALSKGLISAAFPTPLTPLEQATLAKLNIDLGDKGVEAAEKRATLEDTAISASAGISALDTISSIPGAETFLLNPGMIRTARQALSLGRLDPTGTLSGLPSAVSGIPPDQLEIALNAAETVNKQRSALGLGFANQAGTAGLITRLEGLGKGAGLDVQRDVFNQALQLSLRTAEKAGEPINLEGLLPSNTQPNTSTTITPQPGVPPRTQRLSVERVGQDPDIRVVREGNRFILRDRKTGRQRLLSNAEVAELLSVELR